MRALERPIDVVHALKTSIALDTIIDNILPVCFQAAGYSYIGSKPEMRGGDAGHR